MPTTQTISNGKVDTTTTAAATKTDSGNSTLDKQAFLQLLVAQMQYQDPLEPTDNTEYISQLATFSQLESSQNLQTTQENAFASSLVGKRVILNVATSTGAAGYVNGTVDYVLYDSDGIMLSVNDNLYSIDTLDTIVTDEYYDSSSIAVTFSQMMADLPSVSKLTLDDADQITAAREYYDALSSYQQGFISNSDLDKLKILEEKIAELTETSTDDETTAESGE
ncbi:MAG: flagellar hook assembly protein FlgD [Lachnospiraceae bacterium]